MEELACRRQADMRSTRRIGEPQERYAKKANLRAPITKTATLSILKRAREILRKHLKMPRGELAHAEMTEKRDLQLARRHLERHFPTLRLAENQWAAACFLQEVARRDEKKGGARSRDIIEGDWEGKEAAGSSLARSQGGVGDEGETGAFGEEADLQETSAEIFPGVIAGRRESQPRSRIAPTTARSR